METLISVFPAWVGHCRDRTTLCSWQGFEGYTSVWKKHGTVWCVKNKPWGTKDKELAEPSAAVALSDFSAGMSLTWLLFQSQAFSGPFLSHWPFYSGDAKCLTYTLTLIKCTSYYFPNLLGEMTETQRRVVHRHMANKPDSRAYVITVILYLASAFPSVKRDSNI